MQKHTMWRDCLSGEDQTRRVGVKACWGFFPLCAFVFSKIPSWLPEKEANAESNSNYSLISSPLHVEGSGATKNEMVFIGILLLFKMIKDHFPQNLPKKSQALDENLSIFQVK